MTSPVHDISCAPDRIGRVLQLASAASPVGSYAYSDGLEFAVHTGDVHDEASAVDWIGGLLEHSVCAMDVPLLSTMYRAWHDERRDDALAASAWLLACRESAELPPMPAFPLPALPRQVRALQRRSMSLSARTN